MAALKESFKFTQGPDRWLRKGRLPTRIQSRTKCVVNSGIDQFQSLSVIPISTAPGYKTPFQVQVEARLSSRPIPKR